MKHFCFFCSFNLPGMTRAWLSMHPQMYVFVREVLIRVSEPIGSNTSTFIFVLTAAEGRLSPVIFALVVDQRLHCLRVLNSPNPEWVKPYSEINHVD